LVFEQRYVKIAADDNLIIVGCYYYEAHSVRGGSPDYILEGAMSVR